MHWSIFLVKRSRSERQITPNRAKIDAGWKLSRPGFTIKTTPIKPMNTAVHRLHPTFSLKIKAAPNVTKSGAACKIADTVESGIKEIEVIKKRAPNISAKVRRIISLLLII